MKGDVRREVIKYAKTIGLLFITSLIVACTEKDEPIQIKERHLSVKLLPLSKAYAKNSINTSVFRTNSICSDANYQLVTYFDSEGYVTIAKRAISSEKWEITKTEYKCDCSDAHNGISIALDGEGYIHIAYDQHANRLTYRKSLRPYDPKFGELLYMVNSEEEQKVTYPEFYRKSNGNIIFVYRDGRSGNGDCVMNEYSTTTHQWSRIQSKLLDGEGQRNAYWQLCLDNSDNICASWVWRETGYVETNHDMCYAFSNNSGYEWYNSQGTMYAMPINIKNAEIAWEIPQNSELINQTSMTADKDGHPYIATYWREADSDVPQYRIIFNDGLKWNQIQVSNRKTPFTLSGAGTKRIPIARPQMVIDNGGGAIFLFRDIERGEVVSMFYCENIKNPSWNVRDLTDFSVEAWEPTVDTDRWRREQILDIYVQKSYQGDGEVNVETAESEMAYVLEVNWQ